MPGSGDFRWIRTTVLRDAGCITLIQSDDPVAVMRGLGGDPGQVRRQSLSAAESLANDADSDELTASEWLAIRPLDSWILVVEVNGWQGSRPEVLDRVSTGTRAVSAYWNVNGVTLFSYAVAGRVLTAFDAVFPERREGADPDCLEGLSAGLAAEEGEEILLMLALAARVTGLAPVPGWLDGDFDVVPMEPLPEAVRPSINPGTEQLTYSDPPLAWALRHAADEPVRQAAQAAARYAARVTGLESEPKIAEALRPDAPDLSAELGKLLSRYQRAARRNPDDRGPSGPSARASAVTTVREAGNPLNLAAGFRAAKAAETLTGWLELDDGALRSELLAILGNPPMPSGSMGLTASPDPLPADKYAWTSAHWLAGVGAITFFQGSVADAAYAFGPGPDGADTGIPRLFHHRVAAIREEDGWAIAVENHERLGPFAPYENLQAKTVTITWSARGQARLHYSDQGQLLVMLNPQAPEQMSDAELAILAGYLDGLHLGPTGTGAAACLPTLLIIAERLTGITFDPAMLDQQHLLVPSPRHLGGRSSGREKVS